MADRANTARPRGDQRPTTLRDVSRVAGVSLITVSRALREPQTVLDETRKRIHAAIEETGYVPNLAARALVSSRSDIVGIAVPTIGSSLFADLAETLANALQPHGIQVMLGVYEWSPDREAEMVAAFVGRRVDAIVLTGHTHGDATRRFLAKFDGPVVEVGSLADQPIDLCVGFDNSAAAAEMTHYLIQRGHRRICAVHGATEHNDQARERVEGFVAAMREGGLPVNPDYIIAVDTPTTIEQGRAAIEQLLARSQPPSAVFLHADNLAHGALMECLKRGLEVPRDLAIAGFGDLPLSALLPVPLTTIRSPIDRIGTAAADLIMRRLDGQEVDETRVDVGYQLMPRASA